MTALNFDVELRWTGIGRKGIGEIRTSDLLLDVSTPESMGGQGVGANPEGLLVCAVSSCYSATLFAVLRRAWLPVDSLAVGARGAVIGSPSNFRFDHLTVSPTILGGDPTRQSEYETAAVLAHDLCLIGNTLAPEVTYEVSSVHVRNQPTPAPNGEAANASDELQPPPPGDPTQQALAWRSGE